MKVKKNYFIQNIIWISQTYKMDTIPTGFVPQLTVNYFAYMTDFWFLLFIRHSWGFPAVMVHSERWTVQPHYLYKLVFFPFGIELENMAAYLSFIHLSKKRTHFLVVLHSSLGYWFSMQQHTLEWLWAGTLLYLSLDAFLVFLATS